MEEWSSYFIVVSTQGLCQLRRNKYEAAVLYKNPDDLKNTNWSLRLLLLVSRQSEIYRRVSSIRKISKLKFSQEKESLTD